MKISRSIILVVLAAAAIAGGTAGTAEAGLTCERPADRVFARWLDPIRYFLADNGGFEAGGRGWTLEDGAKVVSGNEPFFLNSAADKFSLSLPAGATATSPWTCASVDGLVTRLVALAGGSSLATLQVDLLYKTADGRVKSVALSAISAGQHGSWAPTAPIVVGASTLVHDALRLDANTTQVAFRFRASSGLFTSANWKLDDVYVDPWADNLGW